MDMDHPYLLGWEVKSRSPERAKTRKLKLALQKRRIISDEIRKLGRFVRGMRKKRKPRIKQKYVGDELKLLEEDPFIRVYLKVYRELCGKKSLQEIANEVLRRWNCMKRKPRKHRKKNKDPIKSYGLLYGLVLQGKQNGKTSRVDQNKLKMALIKNKIVSQEIARLTNFVKKMNKEKNYSRSFIKVYLKVFREMCGRSREEEIRREAIERWNKATRADANNSGNECKGRNRSQTKTFIKRHECGERHNLGQAKKHKHECAKPEKKKRKCPYHTHIHPHVRHCPHHLLRMRWQN